jgi:Rrf2 family iron-sulfur cluster assembly transcriptional regulator
MLSNSCRYGIRAVIYLAGLPKSSGKTGIKKISSDLDLPMQLARQKILSSSKGPGGGFSLLKDPGKITLLDIVNTIDGKDVFTNCVMYNGTCQSIETAQKKCPLHDEYEKPRGELIALFTNKTIYDLVKDADEKGSFTI